MLNKGVGLNSGLVKGGGVENEGVRDRRNRKGGRKTGRVKGAGNRGTRIGRVGNMKMREKIDLLIFLLIQTTSLTILCILPSYFY